MRVNDNLFAFNCMGCNEIHSTEKIQGVQESEHLCQRCKNMSPKSYEFTVEVEKARRKE